MMQHGRFIIYTIQQHQIRRTRSSHQQLILRKLSKSYSTKNASFPSSSSALLVQGKIASSSLTFPSYRPFATQSGKNEKDDDDNNDANDSLSTEWIPPNRPLPGDMAQTHLYPRQTQNYRDDDDDDDDEALKALQANLKHHEEHGDTVHYIDLEKVDFSKMNQSSGKPIFVDDDETLDDHYFTNDDGIIEITDDLLVEDEEDLDYILEHADDGYEKAVNEMMDMEEELLRNQQQQQNDDDDVNEDSSEIDQFLSLQEKEKTSTIPDWLQKRRQSKKVISSGGTMLSPSTTAKKKRAQISQIPILRPHTLFSSSEIISCLSSLGGQDIKLIIPDDVQRIQCDGLIVVTGYTTSHIKNMADALVANLRARKLQYNGVVGATKGAEGGSDITTTKKARKRLGRGSKKEDDWMIVDCGNYVVHLQDEVTRAHLNLEGLWSSEKGSEGYSIVHEIDWEKEEDVEDYLAMNPIPEEYANRMGVGGNEEQGGGTMMVDTMAVFSRKKWGQRWNPPTLSNSGKERNRKKKKKRGGGGSGSGGRRSGGRY